MVDLSGEEGGIPNHKPAASCGRSNDRRETELRKKREDRVLKRANEVKVEWRSYLPAFQEPWAQPSRNLASWDFVIKEAKWLANDVMQERLWKMAVARHLANSALEHLTLQLGLRNPADHQDSKNSSPQIERALEQIEEPTSKQGVGNIKVEDCEDMDVDPSANNLETSTASPNGCNSVACETDKVDPIFTFSWKSGSKKLLVDHLKKKEEETLINFEKMKIKYEHDYELARCISTFSGGESEIESDSELPVLGFIGGINAERDDMQIDDDGKATSAEIGRVKKRRQKRPSMFTDNDHSESRELKRSRTVPASQRCPPDTPQGSGRGVWSSRRGHLPKGLCSVLSNHEDQLLYAANGEFNGNWHIISDFLASSGIYMRPETCREKIMVIEKDVRQLQAQQLQAQQHGQPNREDVIFHDLRARAKDYLGNAISDVMIKKRKAAVAQQFTLMMQRKTEHAQQERQSDVHSSHQRTAKIMLSSMGQRLLTPKDAWLHANHRTANLSQQMMPRNNSLGNMDSAQSGQSGQSNSQSLPKMTSQMMMDMPQNVNSVAAMGVMGQNNAGAPATASPSPQPAQHSARGGQGSMSGGNNQIATLQAMIRHQCSAASNPALLQHHLQNASPHQLPYVRQAHQAARQRQAQAQAQAQAHLHVHAQAMANTNGKMGINPQAPMPPVGYNMQGRVNGMRPSNTSPLAQASMRMAQANAMGQGRMPGMIPLNPRAGMQPNPSQMNAPHPGGLPMHTAVPMNQQNMQLQSGAPQMNPQAVNQMQSMTPGSNMNMSAMMGLPGRVVASTTPSPVGMGPGIGSQMPMMGIPNSSGGPGNMSMLAGSGVLPSGAMGSAMMHSGVPQSSCQLGPGPPV